MDKLKALWHNNRFRFALVTLLYVLVFVVWMRNVWMLLGVVVIYDIYISKFFSRYVLEAHRKLRSKNHTYKVAAEWIEAVLFAVVVASIIHIFIFQMYVIPSPSMEKSLLVGDYLYVSKLTYGPKMPNTPLSFPLVHNTLPGSKTGAKSYSELIRRPYKRLAGLKPIRHGDVVVFNFPAGDTVLLENIATTYYDEVRRQGRNALKQRYTIVARPVDKRENYVKRCVGLPGDSISLVASRLYINGKAQNEIPGMEQTYRIYTDAPFSNKALSDVDLSQGDLWYSQTTGLYILPLTAAGLEKVKAMPNVSDVEPTVFYEGTADIFPNTGTTGWSENDFGPLWIPAKGATTPLTVDNLPLYERIIDVYEGNDLRVEGDTIYINGEAAASYTFKMDYYWMMGDNRQNSADSRFWGFVPEDHIVGKASFVWLSLDAEKGWFDGKIRWNKMFRKIR